MAAQLTGRGGGGAAGWAKSPSFSEKKILMAPLIALKEKVRKEELKNAENALDLHLEKERHALEMVAKKVEIVKMGELLSENKSLLKEMKVNFEKMLQTTLDSIEEKMKNYDERVSELMAEKEALEKKLQRTDQTMGKGFVENELQTLRSHRSELTKMGEKLGVALKESKAENATIENQLKVVKLEAAKTEEDRKILEHKLAEEKKRHFADLKILKDEKAALEATREKDKSTRVQLKKIGRKFREQKEEAEKKVAALEEEKKKLEEDLAKKASEGPSAAASGAVSPTQGDDEFEIAQEQLSEAQTWQQKFEESLRMRERRNLVGKEDIDGESNLPEQECLNEEQPILVTRGEYQSNYCPHSVLTKLIPVLEP